MEKWRFLEVDWMTYAETAIYRPVLMRAVSEGVVPNTVSFFKFPKPSLVMAYFCDPEKEVNLDFCRERGIPVYRILAGGGVILGDTGYVVTLLHLDRKNPKLPPDPPGMYEKVLSGFASGLSEYFNIECRFRPLNDIEVKSDDGVWRKIGPSSCVYEEKAVQMVLGMQLKEPNTDLIAQAIAAPPEKFADKKTKSVQERITYLEKVVGRSVEVEEMKEIYKDQFEQLFDVKLHSGQLTEKEKRYYDEMAAEHTSNEYFMERSEHRFGTIASGVNKKMIQFKVPEGPFVRITTLIKQDRIADILISGTIHASPLRPTSPIHEIEKELKNQPIDEGLFKSKIEDVLNRPGFSFAGISPQFLANKIYACATR